jgi:acyl-coenzyme A synthetase/AMP-(fatty) acid ligase
VPKAFVVTKDKSLHALEFVDAIPKTASGKILRRVLKDEEHRRAGLASP